MSTVSQSHVHLLDLLRARARQLEEQARPNLMDILRGRTVEFDLAIGLLCERFREQVRFGAKGRPPEYQPSVVGPTDPEPITTYRDFVDSMVSAVSKDPQILIMDDGSADHLPTQREREGALIAKHFGYALDVPMVETTRYVHPSLFGMLREASLYPPAPQFEPLKFDGKMWFVSAGQSNAFAGPPPEVTRACPLPSGLIRKIEEQLERENRSERSCAAALLSHQLALLGCDHGR